ncbi:unnamed protein product [Amoebophrya sp. A25]|nr:unnamed protein product [Amoebophrya sp. A25]|eukprot:GSA25T00000249001.1
MFEKWADSDGSSDDDMLVISKPAAPKPGGQGKQPLSSWDPMSKVDRLAARRKAEEEKKRAAIIGSDDDKSSDEERAKRRKKGTGKGKGGAFNLFDSAPEQTKKASSGLLSFLPPPKTAGSNVIAVKAKTSANGSSSSAATAAGGAAAASTAPSSVGASGGFPSSSSAQGINRILPTGMLSRKKANSTSVCATASAKVAARNISRGPADYDDSSDEDAGGDEKAMFTTKEIDYSKYAKPSGSSSAAGSDSVAAPDLSNAATSSSAGVLEGNLYVDPAKLKAEFLAQYGGAENLSKQELRDLEEAFEMQQRGGAVKTLDASELYNEKWLESNPAYMVELLEKRDSERANDANSLVGYQVQAGSTTQVTSTQKRKHQITYLAAKARATQQEVSAAFGSGHSVRNEAGQKYGW